MDATDRAYYALCGIFLPVANPDTLFGLNVNSAAVAPIRKILRNLTTQCSPFAIAILSAIFYGSHSRWFTPYEFAFQTRCPATLSSIVSMGNFPSTMDEFTYELAFNTLIV